MASITSTLPGVQSSIYVLLYLQYCSLCRNEFSTQCVSDRCSSAPLLPRCAFHRPFTAEGCGLGQHGIRCLLLLVGWVAVFAEDALDQHT